MGKIDRRKFLVQSVAAVGSAIGTGKLRADAVLPTATRPTTQPVLLASDVVVLGKSGLKASRLAMGTGTVAGSEQRALGIEGMVKLFRYGLDRGVSWWDAADMYKTHPHIRATLKEIKRDRVTITTKTSAKNSAAVRADVERFRKEMDTDYIDIVLLHCMKDAKWPEKMTEAMDVLCEAKEKGMVRAVGCSCHSLGALQAAANEAWVDVILARVNPFAVMMDVKKPSEVERVLAVLQRAHRNGKGICAMKILGEGRLKGSRIDTSLRFILNQPVVSGFTIGFSKPEQIDDIARRIEQNQST